MCRALKKFSAKNKGWARQHDTSSPGHLTLCPRCLLAPFPLQCYPVTNGCLFFLSFPNTMHRNSKQAVIHSDAHTPSKDNMVVSFIIAVFLQSTKGIFSLFSEAKQEKSLLSTKHISLKFQEKSSSFWWKPQSQMSSLRSHWPRKPAWPQPQKLCDGSASDKMKSHPALERDKSSPSNETLACVDGHVRIALMRSIRQ